MRKTTMMFMDVEKEDVSEENGDNRMILLVTCEGKVLLINTLD